MRAILICVDYWDYLEITLPYNRHHFDQVTVVTFPTDEETIQVAKANDASVFTTESFYAEGAEFNKFRALEEGLDHMGREGWICVMDADVLWPRVVELELQFECLHTPYRRMFPFKPNHIPPEESWQTHPRHRNVGELAGYSQIFHADDPHLPDGDWYGRNWRHCGVADSLFQRNWPSHCKIRPPFEVLHIGPSATNWCGRTNKFPDGTVPADATNRRNALKKIMRDRRRDRDKSYRSERIK